MLSASLTLAVGGAGGASAAGPPVVTTTAADGEGSLARAIALANTSPGVRETITFAIPGDGPHRISGAMPPISDPVNIDATTQPGYVGLPLIELFGDGDGVGLQLLSGNTTVKGLAIGHFDVGVELGGVRQVTIEASHLGTDASGTVAVPNRVGLHVRAGSAGVTLTESVVSANLEAGVHVEGPSEADLVALLAGRQAGLGQLLRLATSDVTVSASRIGVGADGRPLGNGGAGLQLAVVQASTVGGEGDRDGNDIAYNGGAGVSLERSTGVTVRGNRIHSNGAPGITIAAADGSVPPPSPTLSVAHSGRAALVTGTLVGGPQSRFRIELFGNPSCVLGEGRAPLSLFEVTGDEAGRAEFVSEIEIPDGWTSITATATDGEGSTSEFSPCATAVAAAGIPVAQPVPSNPPQIVVDDVAPSTNSPGNSSTISDQGGQAAVAADAGDSMATDAPITGACGATFTGALSSAVNVAGNWDTGVVPGATTVACISAGKSAALESGTFTVAELQAASTSVLSVSAGSFTVHGAADLAGEVRLFGGELLLNGPSQLAALTWSGGTTGGTGDVTVVDGTWSGGSKTLGSVLRGEGDVVWSGGRVFLSVSGAGVLVGSGGSLTADASVGELRMEGVSAGRFEVAVGGSVRVVGDGLGDGWVLGGVVLVMAGSVEVDRAVWLWEQMSGSVSGSVVLAGGGRLLQRSGSVSFVSGASLIDGGSGGSLWVEMGVVSFGAGALLAVSSVRLMQVNGVQGVLRLVDPHTLSGLDLASGRLENTAEVVVNTWSWSSGEIAGPGAVVVPAAGTATWSGGSKTLGSVLRVEGDVVWSGGSVSIYDESSAIAPEIVIDGSVDVLNDTAVHVSTVLGAGQPVPALRVGPLGRLAKRGAGTLAIDARLHNVGEVDVLGGELDLRVTPANFTGTTLTGGIWRIEEAQVRMVGANVVTNASQIALRGPTARFVDQNGSSALRNLATNGGTLTLEDGHQLPTASLVNDGLLWVQAGSRLSVSGNFTNSASGTYRSELAGDATWSRVVATGTASLAGTLDVDVVPPFLPALGTSFALLDATVVTGAFTSEVGTGDDLGNGTSLSVVYDAATGDVVVTSVALPTCHTWDGGARTDSWHDAANWVGNEVPVDGDDVCIPFGATVTFDAGQLRIASLSAEGSETASAAVLAVTGGTLTVDGVTNIIDVLAIDDGGEFVSGSALIGSVWLLGGALTVVSQAEAAVDDELFWTAGRLGGLGRVTIGVGALATLGGPLEKILSADVRVDGSLRWEDGDVALDAAAGPANLRIGSVGDLDVRADGDRLYWSGPATSELTVESGGEIHRTVAGTATLAPASFVIDGLADVRSGELLLVNEVGGSIGGHVFPNFTIETGSGTVSFAGGTWIVSGRLGGDVADLRILAGTVEVVDDGDPEPSLGYSSLMLEGGTLVVDDPGSFTNLYMSGGILTGSADLTVLEGWWRGGTLRGTGSLRLSDNAEFVVEDAEPDAGPPVPHVWARDIVNEGTLRWQATRVELHNDLDPSVVGLANHDTLSVPQGVFEVVRHPDIGWPGILNSSSGTAFIEGAWKLGELSFHNDGVLSVEGNGRLESAGSIYNEGRLLIEATSDVVTTASFEQGSSGVLTLGVDSHAPAGIGGVQAGSAVLAGALEIVTAEGFVPDHGERYPAVVTGGRTGEFTTVVGDVLADGTIYEVDYPSESHHVEVVAQRPPVLTVGDVIVGEADGTVLVPVKLSHSVPVPIELAVGIASPSTAVSPGDFELHTYFPTIEAGATQASVGLTIVDDAAFEPNETIVVEVFGINDMAEAALSLDESDAQGVVTIVDDDECDTWDGGAGTDSWHDAANWVGDHVPIDGDDVCIPVGADVTFYTGEEHLGSLRVEGSDDSDRGVLTVAGGKLAVSGVADVTGLLVVDGQGQLTSADARVSSLYVFGGVFEAAEGAQVELAAELLWSGGEMRGGGLVTLEPSAAALVTGPGDKTLSGELSVKGRLRWDNGDLVLAAGAGPANLRIRPGGELDIEGNDNLMDTSGPATSALFVEQGGVIRRTEAGITTLAPSLFEVDGLVEVTAGELRLANEAGGSIDGIVRPRFDDTGVSFGTVTFVGGAWIVSGLLGGELGRLAFTGGVVEIVDDGDASPSLSDVEVVIDGGALVVDDPHSWAYLAMASGTLDGSADLLVKDGVLTGGTVRGLGSIVVGTSASFTVTSPEPSAEPSVPLVVARNIVNDGVLDWGAPYAEVRTDLDSELVGILNRGYIGFQGTPFLAWMAGTLAPGLVNEANSTIDVTGSLTLADFDVDNKGTLAVARDAELSVFDGDLGNEGELLVSTGARVVVTGAFRNRTSGSLVVGIEDPVPGEGEVFVNADTVALAGTLEIVTADAFTPDHLTVYRVVTARDRTGTFARL
ncbi:MAG TPA: right-handed parallel beta-helix repeat-containing protein, partial [Acidimicrobiales bacterium]